MIKITYFYSACVAIETANVRILTDPWFTDGVYDGSWYQYPRIANPLEAIGPCDLIYISHIHPDHYDPMFLKAYLAKYPARVLIADFKTNFLSRKMKAQGIPHEAVTTVKCGDTNIGIFTNELVPDDVDSALAVTHGGHAVVNMNDNLYNPRQLDAIRAFCGESIDIALMGYTGAGPYPQTYYRDQVVLAEKAEAKKQQFFARYRQMRDHLAPKRAIPFAGKYILGGALSDLNPYRGVADAVEVTKFDPQAIVLADGGKASIDTQSLTPTAIRSEPYLLEEQRSYWQTLKNRPMLYEQWLDIPVEALPIERHLSKAYQNALRRSHCDTDYFFCLRLPSGEWFAMNAKKESSFAKFMPSVQELKPRSEIEIDPRYLFGLITGLFHWNNAEVGSQFFTTRVPDEFNRQAQSFLNFFHL